MKKDGGYLLPASNDVPRVPITVCLPCDANHALAFLGQIHELSIWNAWQRDTAHSARDAARVWQQIEREVIEELNDCGVFRMTCGCGTDLTETRVTPEGVVEISTDGGETWTPAPGLDPRKTSIQFPPLPGEDGDTKKCQSAQNVRESFEGWLEQLVDVLTVGGVVVGVVTTFVAAFLSGGALIALAAPFGGLLIGAGATTLGAAFNDTVWDDFTCCLVGEVAADGTYSSSAYESVKSCALALGGLAGTVLWNMLNLMGAVGLSNVAASGSSVGDDCGECVCNSEDEIDRNIWATVEGVGNPDMSGTYIDPGTNRWAFRDDTPDYIQLDMGDPEGTRVTEYWIGTPYCCSDSTLNLYLDDTPDNPGGGTLIATWNATLDGADSWLAPDVITEGRYARWELVSSGSAIYFGAMGFSRDCP